MSTGQALDLLDDNRRRNAEIGLAVAVVLIIALLVVPLPAVLLDLSLAGVIGISIVVLLVALQTTNPLDFSSFPALLLLLTLFRLALNVSSTRLILTEGHAGAVIQSFGEFVVGGNFAVGLVIFVILVGINFIVITKGAGRVAEVAARFTLDAMPGKQMAIDADLSAGLIDEDEARRRRDQISRQADFYGAMDGSSKFVKGDAIASLLITAINIIGGIFVGVVQRGMSFSEAGAGYTILTVGDGLVTQVPALVISTAAGIMVTNVTGGAKMGATLARQVGGSPRALWVASGVMAVFGLVPGLPKFPFIALAGLLALVAWASTKDSERRQAASRRPEPVIQGSAAGGNLMEDLLQIDPVELEVGYALIPLVDERQGGDLLDRISHLRKQAALELGVLIPQIRILDDVRLSANEYVIKLRGAEIARAEVLPRFLLALDTGGVVEEMDGVETTDPSFGMPARWIAASRRAEAESYGYVVVEPTTMMATHLMETLKANAAELLGRQDVQQMVEVLKRSHPALVEEIVPAKVSLGVLHRVLQRLLRERVPIRDLVTILEAAGDAGEQSKDPEVLAEAVRRALGNTIARLHMDTTGAVRGVTMGSRLETALMNLFSPRGGQPGSSMLAPDTLGSALRDLNTLASAHAFEGRFAPLIVSPSLRVGVRRLVEPVMPQLPVISLSELPPNVTLSSVATWELSDAA
ncbi:MAG TPA: flagellar biosynthesis protein FlhA [Gemmatimonadales bacterium]|nr:flagellar biosynthesis protein FlhA [Gemmatimonadales bacterium]